MCLRCWYLLITSVLDLTSHRRPRDTLNSPRNIILAVQEFQQRTLDNINRPKPKTSPHFRNRRMTAKEAKKEHGKETERALGNTDKPFAGHEQHDTSLDHITGDLDRNVFILLSSLWDCARRVMMHPDERTSLWVAGKLPY